MPQRPARVVYSESSTKRIILPDWYVPDLDPDHKPLLSECGKFWFDPQEAWRWVNWPSEFCVHVDGDLAGQPLVPLDWQIGPTREIFGWRRFDRDGNKVKIRRYRKAFIGVPRKNSKTTWLSAISLGMTAIDGEQAAQNFLISGTEDQSKENGFRMCCDMIKLSDALRDCGLEAFEDYIEEPVSRSVLRCISATPKGKTGFNVHFIGVDEYHELPDNRLVHALWTGSTARKQPLLLYTTTSGEDPEGPWAGEWDYARSVMTGAVKDETYFSVVYEAEKPSDADADDQDWWQERRVWQGCNPGWGQSVNTETLEDIFKSCRTPDAKAKFQQFHLCRPISGDADFLTTDLWDLCKLKYTEEDWHHFKAYGGLDLSKNRDITHFSLVIPFWQEDVVHYATLLWAFCPNKTVKDRDLEFKYGQWVDNKWLIKTDGNTTDYRIVRETIKSVGTLFDIAEIRFDDWHAAELVQNLQDLDGFEMVSQPQNMHGMGPATARLEELVLAKHLHHNGNPILRWNVGNARVRYDHQKNKMLSKNSSKEKIDGLVAVTIALAGAMHAPRPKKSVYEDRGFRTL